MGKTEIQLARKAPTRHAGEAGSNDLMVREFPS